MNYGEIITRLDYLQDKAEMLEKQHKLDMEKIGIEAEMLNKQLGRFGSSTESVTKWEPCANPNCKEEVSSKSGSCLCSACQMEKDNE